MYLQFLRKGLGGVCVLAVMLAAGCASQENTDDSQSIDREYVLNSKMIGYTGVGGNIDGKMNPKLKALKGERVKVTLVNGELMAHDFVIDQLGVKSDNVLEEGDTTSVTFIATESSDYYCSIPGHKATMSGVFEVVESMGSDDFVYDVGVSPRKNGRPLNLGFERGNLQDWKATGNAFTPKSVTFNAAPWYPDSVSLGQ